LVTAEQKAVQWYNLKGALKASVSKSLLTRYIYRQQTRKNADFTHSVVM